MGYINARGSRLWIGYWDLAKKLHQKRTEFIVGEEAKARAELVVIEADLKAGAEPAPFIGPVTVRRYAERWSHARAQQGLASAGDEHTRLRLHALPSLGHLLLVDVRPRHVRDLVKSLRSKGVLAPRTIRHVYGVLHTMFRDAVVDELIPSNPCILKRGELPRRLDKDPRWRPTAIFTRAEVEQILSSDLIPPDRRVLTALLVLAGLRFGEASALRWQSYDFSIEPLGRLLIASSWCTHKSREKATKTEQPRSVPVHPLLASILAEWKLSGWTLMMGRQPTSSDLIIPSRRGAHRGSNHSLRRFAKDLARLGLRPRRQHDLRRTFISLARTDGARKDVLERVTHGSRGEIIDLYTELPWSLLCEEVSKLKITLHTGKLLKLSPSIGAQE